MKRKSKYLQGFWAMLCSVMAEYSSDITDAARDLPRKKNTKDSIGYISQSDKVINEKVGKHRCAIFAALTSETFVHQFPQMKEVMELPHSEMEKTVIFMIGIGLNPYDVSKMLITDKRTIITIKSRRKEDIQKIFH